MRISGRSTSTRAASRALADEPHQLESVAVGQLAVDDRQVNEGLLDQPSRARDRAGLHDLVAVGGEVVGEERAGGAIGVDDEDCFGCSSLPGHHDQ